MTSTGVLKGSRSGRAPSFRAVAIGIDGTLADGSSSPHLLAALRRTRTEGRSTSPCP